MLETYYRMLKHNPEGELVKDSGLIPSHSYVIQFLEMVEGFCKFDANRLATDVDGAENEIFLTHIDMPSQVKTRALVGDNTYGIVVGTNEGATPEDNENYSLDTKIAEGSASGELSYQAVTFAAPASNGNVDFDITRTFLNEHASDSVTVKEIGLICKTVANYFLLLRDVVADETVLAGYTLTVVYTLRTTV